ncbi:MAG: hypothetical protein SGCHY_005080, partial [Lobulomycetales sp.]
MDEESEIQRQLTDFKRKAVLLKRDPGVTLEDINEECNVLSKIMERLRRVRSESGRELERNQLDVTLDMIWMILFESWARVAQIDRSLYPLYCKLSNVYHELLYFEETGAYLQEDFDAIRSHIALFEEYCVIDSNKFVDPSIPEQEQIGERVPVGQACLSSLWARIHRKISLLTEKDIVDEALKPVRVELVQLSRSLDQLGKAKSVQLGQVSKIQKALADIEKRSSLGVFGGSGSSIPAGQACIQGLLNVNYEKAHALVVSLEDPVSDVLRPVFEDLLEVKAGLENLLESFDRFEQEKVGCSTRLTRQASPRVMELQERLGAIEASRVNGAFYPKGGSLSEIPQGQAVLHNMLDACYASVHRLQHSSDIVDNELIAACRSLVVLKERLLSLKSKA